MTEEIRDRDAIRGHADDVLRTIYVPEFVDSIKDPVDAALDVHKLYSTAPGMAKETDITFARYVPEDDREPLSYATDAETFYEYGPGVKGETNTTTRRVRCSTTSSRPSTPASPDRRPPSVYRFAHGETTMPFAALIKAPGSE